ncbi:MAG: hypothetical protein FWG65_04445 [Turicibacter sp.]|nr:hypothetical protein [Turicibacter sp.]
MKKMLVFVAIIAVFLPLIGINNAEASRNDGDSVFMGIILEERVKWAGISTSFTPGIGLESFIQLLPQEQDNAAMGIILEERAVEESEVNSWFVPGISWGD